MEDPKEVLEKIVEAVEEILDADDMSDEEADGIDYENYEHPQVEKKWVRNQ